MNGESQGMYNSYFSFRNLPRNIAKLPKSFLIPIGLFGLAVIWILSGTFMRKAPELSSLQEGSLFSVQVMDAQAQLKEVMLHIQGQTKASCVVDVRAEVEGKVISILEKGQKVEKNQPLIQLQLEDRDARFAKAKARYSQRSLEYQAAVRLNKQGFRSPFDVARSRASLGEAKADLETARYEIENSTIKAPFSGILDDKKVNLGDYVLKGDKVGRLIDLDPMRAVGFVQEQDVQKISSGKEGLIVLKNETIKGKVTFISASADPQTRMFQIELSAPNPNGKIPDGLTAEIQIPLEKTLAHFITPAILTLKDDGTMGVKIVTSDDEVQFCPVQIAASEKAGVWVKGLPERVCIITVGQEFVVEGQKVKPVLK